MKFKETIISKLESQYELRLQKSTWIEAFKLALKDFPELGSFQTWGQDLINEVAQQLNVLNQLGLQIKHFKDNQGSLITGLAEIETFFTQYDEQEAQNKAKLSTLFIQNAIGYFQGKNDFHRQLSDEEIPLLVASLNLDDPTEFENRLTLCIKLIKNYIKNPEKLLNFFKIINQSSLHLDEPNLSHFIFIARKQATQLLQKSIETNFSKLNLQQIKQDCENQDLYSDLYQNYLLLLVNHYQNYSDKLKTIKNKLEFIDNHLGVAVKDWWDDYKTLSDSTFLSTANHKALMEKYDQLCLFEAQLSLNNDREFLKKIKSKVQDFLNNKIAGLEQQYKDYQTRIAKFSSCSSRAKNISNKLLQRLEYRYSMASEIWIKRQERLANIKVIEELKYFKNDFHKEAPIEADLDFKKLGAALLFLEKPHPDKQSFSNIPIEDLTETIFFILENLNSISLPSSIDNLLQFIHSESNNPTLNNAKTSLAIALQAFFNRQPEKLALCLASNAPLNTTTIHSKTYEKLINVLRYTDSDQLKKWSEHDFSLKTKIKELSAPQKINQTSMVQALDRLISTKKIQLLFEATPTKLGSENKTGNYSLWDACCLFKEFANNVLPPELPYLKQLEEEPKTKDIVFNFLEAVMNLNWFITSIQQLEKQSYSPTLFLKSGKNKQKYIHQLINNLKNIPLTQADIAAINNTFEHWKKDHQLLMDKPRYRLLTKLCMLIYRQFMKLFFPTSDCFTNSHQTINTLQEQFLQASQYLQKLREYFTHSTKEITDSVPDETATQLTCMVR